MPDTERRSPGGPPPDPPSATGADPAEVYEAVFVPALFGQWAEHVATAARLQADQRVLDVACGTGVLARKIFDQQGGRGAVVGLDANEGMLAVAARRNPRIEWRHGRAEALPFENGSFDRVVSQFGLMFFGEPRVALAEMWRVLRPDGRLVVAVFDAVERSPGYLAFLDVLERTLGTWAADALRLPFALGSRSELKALFRSADISPVRIRTLEGMVRFPSIRDWVTADVKGWLAMFGEIREEDYERVLADAASHLGAFLDAGGSVAFPIHAHLISAERPAT